MTDNGEPDTLNELLARVPDEVALYLRDLLRGLEAEAGNARARATRVQELLGSDVNRLRMYAAGLKTKLDEAEEALELAEQESAAAKLDLAAARSEVAALESGNRRGRR